MPGSWLFQYALRNGGSVAAFCVTSYSSGVSFFFSSSADGFGYAPSAVALATVGVGSLISADDEGRHAPSASTHKKMRFMRRIRAERSLGFAASVRADGDGSDRPICPVFSGNCALVRGTCLAVRSLMLQHSFVMRSLFAAAAFAALGACSSQGT